MAKTTRLKPLSRIIGGRIIAFALIAMALQVVVVLVKYYADDADLAALMVQGETRGLLKGVSVADGGLRFTLPAHLQRYSQPRGDYYARIRTPDGQVIFSNCDATCVTHLLPEEVHPPDFWSRQLRPGKPIAVAGGRVFETAGGPVFIEVAVLDDHERILWHVLRDELADHLAVPMSLLLVFVLGGMLLSVRLALRPVERAARQAEFIDPLDSRQTIDIAGMPREVAELGAAVNRMLGRITALMQAQRIYTTAIAHEIRTPLAMAKLELGNIPDPRARKIEQDLDALTHFVAQVTELGRLEGVNRAAFRTIDLAALGRSVVSDIAPWVYDSHARIGFEDAGAAPVEGHAALVENALRNLIENAVRHTGGRTTIDVVAGPGPCLSVSDDAGLFGRKAPIAPARDAADEGIPDAGIGLEIVRRIMRLHRGRLETAVDPLNRTTMRLAFAPVPPTGT